MAYPDLVTSAQVREHLTIATAQTGRDALIAELISRASIMIMEFAEREFFADGSLGSTRTFVYEGGGFLSFAPFDLRTLSSIVIDTDGTSPADTTLTADQYRLEPRQRRHGVYTGVELRGLSPVSMNSAVDYRPSRELEVTGTWGFSSVPEDVQEATILTVMHLFRHYGQAYPADGGFEVDLSSDGRRSMPFAAVEILRRYRRGR
jgi:hypothetical protein